MSAAVKRAALAALLVGIGFASTASADPLKIRIGMQTPPDKFLTMLAHRKDVVPHVDTSYELVPVRFAASSEEVTALATGDLDIGNLAYSSLAIAIENAKLDDIRMVAESLRDGVPGYFSYQFRVKNDSPIKTVEDLKGKIVGSNGIGSATDMGSRLMMRRHGLEDRRDYSVVAAPLPNLVPMLMESKVDVTSIGSADVLKPQVQAGTRTLFTQADAFGVTQLSLYVARAPWLAKNRAALDDFFEDLVRATRWSINPANRDTVAALFAANTKQPIDSLGYFMTKNDFYRDPDARPDIGATQKNINAMRDLGFIKNSIDVAKYTDVSFIDRAVVRIDAKGH
ncbi:MAG TPA: ABC transporter substrate-binding protein [Stellaceae bacterium]|nr:ABC transporter substrate-binding protein [Stellaceae bacterium]